MTVKYESVKYRDQKCELRVKDLIEGFHGGQIEGTKQENGFSLELNIYA